MLPLVAVREGAAFGVALAGRHRGVRVDVVAPPRQTAGALTAGCMEAVAGECHAARFMNEGRHGFFVTFFGVASMGMRNSRKYCAIMQSVVVVSG